MELPHGRHGAAAEHAADVTLTAPVNGATFGAPATITLTANAADSDGTIAKVDFFAGATLIGTDTTSPYAVTWNNVAAGTYSVSAVASDDDSAATASSAATVTVGSAPPPSNAPPSVALTAPSTGATFDAPGTINLTATAGDTDGTIAKVDFFAGTTLIGTDTTSPYAVTWNNVADGHLQPHGASDRQRQRDDDVGRGQRDGRHCAAATCRPADRLE